MAIRSADYDHDGDALVDDSGRHNRGSQYSLPRGNSHGTEAGNRSLDKGVVATRLSHTSILEQYQLGDQDYTNMPVDATSSKGIKPVNPTKYGGGVPIPKFEGGQANVAAYQNSGPDGGF